MDQALINETLKGDLRLTSFFSFLLAMVLVPLYLSIKPQKAYIGIKKDLGWECMNHRLKTLDTYDEENQKRNAIKKIEHEARFERKLCVVFVWILGLIAFACLALSFF